VYFRRALVIKTGFNKCLLGIIALSKYIFPNIPLSVHWSNYLLRSIHNYWLCAR